MAYVIAEPCIGTKDNSCVEVCPVDCIHPTPDEPDYDNVKMLYIDPEECIDCDACVEACPVDACFAEDQLSEEVAPVHPGADPDRYLRHRQRHPYGLRGSRSGRLLHHGQLDRREGDQALRRVAQRLGGGVIGI